MIIEFFDACMSTTDGRILYLLSVICGAMIIDFMTGSISAKINKEIVFESQKGINGILRKITSMIVMVFFIPVSVLIPNGMGVKLLFVLYVGYLGMELKSILENLNKMGINIALFSKIVEMLSNIGGKEN